MSEFVLSPELAYRFIIWSYFYHDIVPEKEKSFSVCGKFCDDNVRKLDEMKDLLFMCFEKDSVEAVCQELSCAKAAHEPCPFSQELLDSLFAREKKL